MKKMTVYEAKDGTIFYTEEACKEYEEKLNNSSKHILIVAKEIQEFCSRAICDNCPFMTNDYRCKLKKDFPNQWEL